MPITRRIYPQVLAVPRPYGYLYNMWIRSVCVASLVCGASIQPLNAHPHIYVDAGVQFIFDSSGDLAALRVTWIYDDLYSLLITEDFGLDADLDGILMPEEREKLSGFDMNWVEGFAGDTVGFGPEGELGLSRPVEWSADLKDGRIVTTHVRALDTPIDPTTGEVVLRLFDPSFYTAYSASLTPQIRGRTDCLTEVVKPDLDEAYAYLDNALNAQPLDSDAELDFPEVGEAFAEEVHLKCGA